MKIIRIEFLKFSRLSLFSCYEQKVTVINSVYCRINLSALLRNDLERIISYNSEQ